MKRTKKQKSYAKIKQYKYTDFQCLLGTAPQGNLNAQKYAKNLILLTFEIKKKSPMGQMNVSVNQGLVFINLLRSD